MKYIQLIKIVFCFVIIAFCPLLLIAQDNNKIIDVEGIVIGTKGEPLSGVLITSKEDTNISANTDVEGKFFISVPSNSNLSISRIGYETRSVLATPELIQIQLNHNKSEELVQVAFRKVKDKDLVSGISYVNLPEILDKNYTTYSLDGLQAFVGGYNGNIWGTGGSLVLIDGVPRNANTILPTEIEQVTFLKGVSAITLYGSRAAKGVIYITSKKGKTQKQEIKVRVDGGIITPKRFPKYLRSGEYMYYYNQARENDGLGALYSDETIYNYASGNSPYRYADVDYYSSDYISDFFTRYDANLEITGGSESTRYYTTVNFSTQGDLLNFGEAKNNKTERFNIRGNVDFDINSFLSAFVSANAIYYMEGA